MRPGAVCAIVLLVAALGGARGPKKMKGSFFNDAYLLMSVLDRTAFSKAFSEAAKITGYLFIFKEKMHLEDQLVAMVHEILMKLPWDVQEDLSRNFTVFLDSSLAGLKAEDPKFVAALTRLLKRDLQNMVVFFESTCSLALKEAERFDVGENFRISLFEFEKCLRNFINYVRGNFSKIYESTEQQADLKDTLISIMKVTAKLPKLHLIDRILCPLLMEGEMPIRNVLQVSQEGAPFHFRSSLEFVRTSMLRRLFNAFARSPEAKSLWGHLETVLPNITADLTRFRDSHGVPVMKDRVRLVMALKFRPFGTISGPEDFEPYLRSVKQAAQRNNLTQFIFVEEAFNLDADIADKIERLTKTGQVTSLCFKSFNQLSPDVLVTLRKRPGFKADSEKYCRLLESFHRAIEEHHQDALKQLHNVMNKLSPNFVDIVDATLAPKNVYALGMNVKIPRNTSVRPQKIIWKLRENAALMFKSTFKNVHRLMRVMHGKPLLCKEYFQPRFGP